MAPLLYPTSDGRMQLSTAVTASMASLIAFVLFLVSAVTCACCTGRTGRRKKTMGEHQQKSTIEGRTKSLPLKEESPSLKSDHSGPKSVGSKTIVEMGPLPPIVEPSMTPTVVAVTACPVTVITAEPKAAGKGKAASTPPATITRNVAPSNAVRYDDPAYRTLGRDVDDPFSMMLSVRDTKAGGKAKPRERAKQEEKAKPTEKATPTPPERPPSVKKSEPSPVRVAQLVEKAKPAETAKMISAKKSPVLLEVKDTQKVLSPTVHTPNRAPSTGSSSITVES